MSSDRAAWLAARREHIGSSDIATLIGLNPYGSPFEVWADKVHGVEQVQTLHMEHGLVLEPWLLELYTRHTGHHARRLQTFHVHPTIPVASATVDGEDETERLIETKVSNAREWLAGRQWDYAEGPSPAQSAQAQWQLAVTGRTEAVIVIYHPDTGRFHPASQSEISYWTVTANADVQAYLLATAQEWWAEWVAPWRAWHHDPHGTQPPIPAPGPSQRVTQIIDQLWPAELGAVCELPAAAYDACETYTSAHAALKRAEEQKADAGNILRLALGAAVEGYVPGVQKPVVTWRPNRNGIRTLRVTAPAQEEAF